MAKAKTWALGGAGLLVGAGIIVVIVLAALGYFNKKGGASPSATGTTFRPGFHPTNSNTHTGYVAPGSGTCMPPQITYVDYQSSTSTFFVQHTPFTGECATGDSRYSFTIILDENASLNAVADGSGHVVEGQTYSSASSYGGVKLVPGLSYTGYVKHFTLETKTGQMTIPDFYFKITA